MGDEGRKEFEVRLQLGAGGLVRDWIPENALKYHMFNVCQ